MAAAQKRIGAVLIGEDTDRTKRWGVIAAGLFMVVFAVYVFEYYQPVYAVVPGRALIYGAAGGLVLLSAWQAYQNRSLLASLLLCIAPVSALFVRIFGAGQTSDPAVGETILLAIGWGLVVGVPLGILGFVLGYACRTLVDPDPSS